MIHQSMIHQPMLRILDEDGTIVIEGKVVNALADGNGELYEISIAAPMRLAWFQKISLAASRPGWRSLVSRRRAFAWGR